MNEEKVIEIVSLKDGQTLESLQINNIVNGLVLHVENGDILALEEILTEQNLKEISISNQEGSVYGKYYSLRAVSLHKDLESGIVDAALKLEDRTEARLSAVEEGQSLQDGAIADLGEVVSTMAEGGAV